MKYYVQFLDGKNTEWWFNTEDRGIDDYSHIIKDLLTNHIFPPMNIYRVDTTVVPEKNKLWASTSMMLDLSEYNENNPITFYCNDIHFKFYLPINSKIKEKIGDKKIIVEQIESYGKMFEFMDDDKYVNEILKNYFIEHFPVIYNRYYGFKYITNVKDLDDIIEPGDFNKDFSVTKKNYPKLYKFKYVSSKQTRVDGTIYIYAINNAKCIYNIPSYKNMLKVIKKFICKKSNLTNPVMIRYKINDNTYIDCKYVLPLAYDLYKMPAYDLNACTANEYSLHLESFYYYSENINLKFYDTRYCMNKSSDTHKIKEYIDYCINKASITEEQKIYINELLNKFNLPNSYNMMLNNSAKRIKSKKSKEED